MSNLLQVYDNRNLAKNQKENELRLHVISLSKMLPDEIKARYLPSSLFTHFLSTMFESFGYSREFLMKFVHHLKDDANLLNLMKTMVKNNVSCRECAETVVSFIIPRACENVISWWSTVIRILCPLRTCF